jgi:sortase A
MRPLIRRLGTLLLVLGIGVVAWAIVVWRWQDPFTALYTKYQQHRLTDQYAATARDFDAARLEGASLAAARRQLAAEARRYRSHARRGDAIGRIRIPRLGLNMLLVEGTDDASLRKGPGRDERSYMPGENRLVYIAGHRTTYLAPFARIERLRHGDLVTIEVPYGTFRYRITRQRIVASSDLSVLRSPQHEQLELQACHPRFFASHRYIAYGRLAKVSVGTATFAPSASRSLPRTDQSSLR